MIIMAKYFTPFFLIGAIILSIAKMNAQSIDLQFPVGGEHWINNTESPHNIIWESTSVSAVDIEYSTDNGNSWNTIAENYSSGDFYTWAVPDINSTEVLIKVSDSGNPAVADQSDAPFSILDQAVYYAKWETSMGDFRAKLHGDKVPVTVQNFINLAERNFYQDLIFHRVIENFMIQDGCPLGTGSGGPGYEFDNEIHPDLNHSHPGVLAMANAGPNTNGSQYYITVKPTTWLDGDYSIFGKIVDGMSIVYDISRVETDANDKPLTDVDIYNISIEEYNPQIAFSYPAASSDFIVGSTMNIQWSSDFVEDIKIEFSSDGGVTRRVIEDSIPAWFEEYAWIVPDEMSENCYLYITGLQDETITATSEVFTIKTKPAEVLSLDFFQNVEAHPENLSNLIAAGRTVRFKALLRNNLDTELNNIILRLSTETSGIEILSETQNFLFIAEGAQVYSEDYFEIRLPDDISQLKNIDLVMSASTSETPDVSWISEFHIPMPEKQAYTYVIANNSGNSSGNGNILIEPGEIGEFAPNIANVGSSPMYNVYGKLTSPQSFISVWNEVNGVNGMVYDSITYNGLNPISANSSVITPDGSFVFDYNANEIFYTELVLEIYASLNASIVPEESPTILGYALSYVQNSDYPSGIEQLNEKDQIVKIYPNPANNYVFIEKLKNQINDMQIEIQDISGRRVGAYRLSGEDKLAVQVSDFKKGIYFISAKTDKHILVKKMIVLH